MATLNDEIDAAMRSATDALTPAPRQSPGPMLHDVYRVLDNGDLRLVMETVEVKARGLAGRREAVTRAGLLAESEGAQYGTFRVVKHSEMSDPITRTQKTEPVDVWS